MVSFVDQTIVTSSTTQSSWVIGAPSGAVDGHFEAIFAFAAAGSHSSLNLTTDGPTATQMVNEVPNNNGSPQGRIVIWRKNVAASPGNVTVNSSPNSAHSSVRMVFGNVDLSSPINAASPSFVEGTNAPNQNPTMTIPGITTTVANCMAVVWLAWRNGGAGVVSDGFRFSVTSGWTRRASPISSFDAGGALLCIATRSIATPGSTGDVVITPGTSSDSNQRNWIGGMFALAPAGGGTARRRVVMIG